MRDWRRLVRERIDRVRLPTAQKEEIAAELGSHLQEVYEEQRRLGLAEPQAFEAALSEVLDWGELRRRIGHAKREERIMNARTKQLWLPGLASFWTAMIFEVTLDRAGFGPLTGGPLFHYRLPGLNYVVWLIAECGCGALGAYLSRRAGGPRLARLFSALFTSLVLLTTMTIVTGICAAGRWIGLGFTTLDFGMLVKPMLVVAAIPGSAMLAGALPFLSERKHTATAQ